VNEPLWISEEIVRFIHQDQIKQHGGSLGIRRVRGKKDGNKNKNKAIDN
jgi:hypothetical protein